MEKHTCLLRKSNYSREFYFTSARFMTTQDITGGIAVPQYGHHLSYPDQIWYMYVSIVIHNTQAKDLLHSSFTLTKRLHMVCTL